MIRQALIAASAALALAGCEAGTARAPVGAAQGDSSTPLPDQQAKNAQFQAQRSVLRRIGYRNCNGFDIQLFAPQRLTADMAGQALYLRAKAYRATGGGAVTLTLPGNAARLQRQSGTGWQNLPMNAAAGASRSTASAGQLAAGSVATVSVSRAVGQSGPLAAGRYRLWLGAFTASQVGGSACSMSPVWQFSVN